MSESPAGGQRRLPRPLPVHPLLFAAYPVLYLYSQNVGEVAPGEVLVPLLLVLAGALGLLVLLSLAFRDPRRAAIVVSVLALGALAYGFVDSFIPSVVPGWTQQLVWIALIVLSIVVAIRIGDRLRALTTALNGISAILVVLTLITIVPALVGSFSDTEASSPTASPSASTGTGTATARDIYYIILDRYGSARSLDLQYGIKDNDMSGWLTDHGFDLEADSHANYVKTALSIASTLRMDFLDDIVARMGKDSGDHQPVFDVFQDPPAAQFLKDRGYRYVVIGSSFSPTRTSAIADENLNLSSTSDFENALYDYSALPAITKRLGLASSSPQRERHRANAMYEFDALEKVQSEPGPKFVFAHFLMPHPPYVFKADGTYVPEDEGDHQATYATQLQYTNTRLKAILEPLLAKPEAERPIIIIQADEGPYPPRYASNTVTFDWSTATPDELEIKYGILNAMYLPGLPDGATLPYPTISPVNTFRLLFDDYFGANLPLLPDRSWTSKGKFFPYDLTEITDRLPTLAR